MRTFDLAVIGGGVSATSVLQDLLPRLTRSARIAVIDRRGDFGGGVPYGSAARAGFLCNNPVHAQHDGSYAEWLDEHQERWLAPLAASGDPLLRRWYAHNAAALARHEYAELFLPRNVYGEFMREKMARLVAAAVEVIRGEVVDLAPGFTLKLADGELLSAHTVLLAPGGAPPICEAVDPSTLDPHQLADRSSIILLGSNATAMEMLWCIDGYAPHVREVTVISRSGRLPDAQRSGLPGVPPMQALDALHDSTAAALARAAEMDVTAALAAGYTSLDASAPLFASFTPRFDALSAAERAEFVARYGRRFKALNRRTTPEYAGAADALRRRGVLRMLRAELTRDDVVRLQETHPAALVLDCRGSADLEQTSDPLLRALFARGLARINGSGTGLAADEELAAAPGLFVAGPLLAGISNARHCFWNLESAKRLFALSPAVAGAIARILHEIHHE